MDINQLLAPDIQPEEVENHILANALLELGKTNEQARIQNNQLKSTRINESQKAGNYANTDMSGNTITSGSSIESSLDENGNVTITNVGTAPNAQMGGISGTTAAEQLSVQNVDARIKALAENTNTTDMALGFGQLQSDLETMKIRIFEQAKTNALVSQRVPELQANLERLQRLDEEVRIKKPNEFVGASPATMQAAQILATATSNAEQLATKSVGSNISIVALENKIKAAVPIINNNLNKQNTAEINKQAKLDMQQEKENALISSIPVETLARVQQQNPTFTAADSAKFLMTKQVQAPEEMKAYTAKPEQLAPIAFKEGNATAEKFLIDEEVGQTGKDPLIVKKEVSEFKALMADTNLLKKTALRMYGEKSEDYQAIVEAIGNSGIASTKEKKIAATDVRYRIATQIASVQKQQAFKSDLTQWKVSGLEEALAKNKQLNLPATMENILNQYVGTTVGSERYAKIQNFTKIMRDAGRRDEGSFIASINTDLVSDEIALHFADFKKNEIINKYISTLNPNPNQLPSSTSFGL
jgi:hypothetical protein